MAPVDNAGVFTEEAGPFQGVPLSGVPLVSLDVAGTPLHLRHPVCCKGHEWQSVHAGLAVLDEGTTAVIEALRKEGVLLKEEKYAHKYPYDWRTKLPTIFRATDQASMTELSTNP